MKAIGAKIKIYQLKVHSNNKVFDYETQFGEWKI